MAHAPFYFFYRHLIEERGWPEVKGLVCEKGIWWRPARPERGDFDDEGAVALVWKFWARRVGEPFIAEFPGAAVLRARWQHWKPAWRAAQKRSLVILKKHQRPRNPQK